MALDTGRHTSERAVTAAELTKHIAGRTLNLTYETVEITPTADKSQIVLVQQFDRDLDRFVVRNHSLVRPSGRHLVFG